MKHLPLLFVIPLLLTSGVVFSHDGTVNIDGSIQGNTCEVSPDSKNQDVDMGVVNARNFKATGSVSAAVKFTIGLENCAAAASAATFTFTGSADSSNTSLLQLTPGTGSATGLGLAILDDSRALIPLGSASKAYPIQSGAPSVVMTFYAQYQSTTATITPGDANASATFTLSYA